jgi:hypothetical protein
VDVYRVRLLRGEQLSARLSGPSGTNTDLVLWKPGTASVADFRSQGLRAAQSVRPGAVERFSYRPLMTGWYFIEVKITTPGTGVYALTLDKS